MSSNRKRAVIAKASSETEYHKQRADLAEYHFNTIKIAAELFARRCDYLQGALKKIKEASTVGEAVAIADEALNKSLIESSPPAAQSPSV